MNPVRPRARLALATRANLDRPLRPHRSATSTEGIFRVSGSNKRINQLQEVFDMPPRYGKDLDWTPYTVHDAASVLRRYLNMMPVRWPLALFFEWPEC